MSEKVVVFEQWVQQHAGLKNLLQGKIPAHSFKDELSWKEHLLRKEFSIFLADYSNTVVKSFSTLQNEKEIAIVLSYLSLFSEDDRPFLEQKISEPFFQKLKSSISTIKDCKNELEIVSLTDTICNDEVVELINHLSRKSYPIKVNYVDEVLSIVHHPQCTARLAYRLVKQLKGLSLNPEHSSTVLRIENELKSGELLAKTDKSKVQFRSFVRPIVFVAVLALVSYGIYYLITSEKPKPDDLNIASSFEDFSVEERKQIDSLIRTMKPQQKIEQEEDIFQWLGNGVVLSIRQPMRNQRMEKMYNDWLLDAALIGNAKVDTCDKTSDTKFPDVLALSTISGGEKVMLRNESNYQSFVFVFDDFQNGKVYGGLINRDQTISFRMKENQGLLFVPGNQLGKFHMPASVDKEECPSSDFTIHFCETDGSLTLALSSIYRFSLPAAQNKLMLVGDSTTQFSVIDLHGILEEF